MLKDACRAIVQFMFTQVLIISFISSLPYFLTQCHLEVQQPRSWLPSSSCCSPGWRGRAGGWLHYCRCDHFPGEFLPSSGELLSCWETPTIGERADKYLKAIEGSEPENLIDRVQGKREDAVQRFKENNNWRAFKATQILSMRFFVYRIMYKPIFQALEHHKQFQYIEQAEVERLDPKCDQWLSGVFHHCNLSFLAAALISDSTQCVFEVRVSLVAESF